MEGFEGSLNKVNNILGFLGELASTHGITLAGYICCQAATAYLETQITI